MRCPIPLAAVAFILASFLSVLFSPDLRAGERPRIEYTVSIPDPAAETFLVTADIYGLKSDTLTFYFPVWAPGAYDIVNFGAYVTDLTARQGGRTLTVRRADTNTFRIPAATDHLRLEYVVDDIEYLENSAWFALSDIEDSTKVAFAVGTALFGYPEGQKDIPYTVTYTPPPGWNLAVALDPVQGKENTYSAANYDELVDAPVQMGTFQKAEFTVKGIPHIITVVSPVPLQGETMQSLSATTENVVKIISDFFDEVPYKRYLFQFYLKAPTSMTESFGALEHANSSTYLMPYYSEELVSTSLQPVISHEYWHLWSPKRFHVSELGPFNYQKGPRTTSLWFHEGLTEYYARALLVRNSQRSRKDFLQTFSSFVQELYGQGQKEPITKLSAELTERPLTDIYGLYTKGPVLGMLLDAEIRVQTGNRKSLDDAMIYFNRNYGDHLGGKDFGDDDIVPIIEKATGARLEEFYRRFIAGTEPLPFDELLPRFGLQPVLLPEIGARLLAAPDGWRISTVYRIGMIPEGGLKKEDVITGIGIGDKEVKSLKELGLTPSKLRSWLAGEVGSARTVTVAYLRGEESLTAVLPVRMVFGGLGIDPAPSAEAEAIRKSMFGF